jgi:hypothetical protein
MRMFTRGLPSGAPVPVDRLTPPEHFARAATERHRARAGAVDMAGTTDPVGTVCVVVVDVPDAAATLGWDGPEAADALLGRVVEQWAAVLAPTTVVARLGDAGLVLVEAIEPTAASALVAALRDVTEPELMVGVASWPRGEDLGGAVRRATVELRGAHLARLAGRVAPGRADRSAAAASGVRQAKAA